MEKSTQIPGRTGVPLFPTGYGTELLIFWGEQGNRLTILPPFFKLQFRLDYATQHLLM